MDRLPITQARTVAALALGGAILLALPALAQNAPPPGSTINGTVPTAEGNVWNGLDHQPTPSEIAPVGNAQQQARINHKLSKLDQQLLNDPLPKLPPGAPAIQGN